MKRLARRTCSDTDCEDARCDFHRNYTYVGQKAATPCDLGADHVIVTQEEHLPTRVREITRGNLPRVAFDAVGGSFLDPLAHAVAPSGTMYLYGLLSGEANNYPVSAFVKSISLTAFMLTELNTPERLEPMKRYVYDHLADGSLRPHVDRVFPFEGTAEAYRYLESNQQVGKVVIAL